MVNSIAYFNEKITGNLEEIFLDYSLNLTKIAELVQGVKDCMLDFGLRLIAEEWERYDTFLCEHKQFRADWYIVRKEEATLLTSIGILRYHKTLFRNKKTGAYEYFLDRAMGLEKHARLTEDAEAEILKEAVQTTYEKAGIQVSVSSAEVSKETVKNKIHRLEFPKNTEEKQEKKEVEYLYIDADEDHVSLQFREKKGEITENETRQKNNHAIVKMVYVYEGIEPEHAKSTRNVLVNPYYFCRVCEGEENKKFWDEVYEYIERKYDLSKIKKIYLNADGGSWIMSGKRRISGISYVLDEFHLKKYLRKITLRFPKKKKELEEELIKNICYGNKKEFEEKMEQLKTETNSNTGKKRIEEGKKYLLSNWTAARLRFLRKREICGSSTESHVSHILSARMSNRPMGWSKEGMAKMAQLRAYYYNDGDMLELVRYQKKEGNLTKEKEEIIYSSSDLWREERKRKKSLGCFADMATYSIPYLQIKKIAHFRHQIFGL